MDRCGGVTTRVTSLNYSAEPEQICVPIVLVITRIYGSDKAAYDHTHMHGACKRRRNLNRLSPSGGVRCLVPMSVSWFSQGPSVT